MQNKRMESKYILPPPIDTSDTPKSVQSQGTMRSSMLQSTPRGRGGRSRSRGRSKGPTPAQAAGGDNNELIDRFIEQLSGYNTQDVVASDSVNFSNTYKNIKKEFGAVLPQREMQVLQDRMNAAHARGGGSGTLIGGNGSSER